MTDLFETNHLVSFRQRHPNLPKPSELDSKRWNKLKFVLTGEYKVRFERMVGRRTSRAGGRQVWWQCTAQDLIQGAPDDSDSDIW